MTCCRRRLGASGLLQKARLGVVPGDRRHPPLESPRLPFSPLNVATSVTSIRLYRGYSPTDYRLGERLGCKLEMSMHGVTLETTLCKSHVLRPPYILPMSVPIRLKGLRLREPDTGVRETSHS